MTVTGETKADEVVSEEVEQLAIKLWLEWLGYQDDAQRRIMWRLMSCTLNGDWASAGALAVEWADQGQRQREAWYDVARRAMELCT